MTPYVDKIDKIIKNCAEKKPGIRPTEIIAQIPLKQLGVCQGTIYYRIRTLSEAKFIHTVRERGALRCYPEEAC